MEKSTVTIEIKQEVTVLFLWIVGGVVLVAAACVFTPSSTELWPALFAGGIAAIVYLLALIISILRKPVSGKARALLLIGFVLTIAALVTSSLQQRSNARWQVEQMSHIRETIARGVIRTSMPALLLRTLETYYQQEPSKKENLAKVFQRLNGNATVGTNIHKPTYDQDSLKTFVQALEPDRVVLVSQELFVKGNNRHFKNYNGLEGMVQEKCILTAKGISYESEN